MVTQIINGQNHYNNEISIDFLTKKVDFKPIYTKDYKIYLIFFTSLLDTLLFVTIWITIISMFSILIYPQVFSNAFEYFGSNDLAVMFTIIKLTMIDTILAFIVSLSFFNPTWKKEDYPKFFAFNIVIKKLLKFQQPYIIKRFNVTHMIDNKIIITSFSNVMIDYRLTDDFADKIKKIDIIANWKRDKKGFMKINPYDFKYIMTFDAGVKDGEVRLKYIQ